MHNPDNRGCLFFQKGALPYNTDIPFRFGCQRVGLSWYMLVSSDGPRALGCQRVGLVLVSLLLGRIGSPPFWKNRHSY